jgi:potassium-transporting ATPase ATP-binding subunit
MLVIELAAIPTAAARLRRDLLIYGPGGLIAPLIGIKAVNLAISGLGLL